MATKTKPTTTGPGQIIRDARLRHDLTQTELADLSGVSQSYLSKLEGGGRELTLAAAAALERPLQLAPYTLIDLARPEGEVTPLRPRRRRGPTSAAPAAGGATVPPQRNRT